MAVMREGSGCGGGEREGKGEEGKGSLGTVHPPDSRMPGGEGWEGGGPNTDGARETSSTEYEGSGTFVSLMMRAKKGI